MIDKAVQILGQNRLMSLATIGEDGWPHCSMVGFANDELSIYFVVSRTSQKLADIGHDDRVAIVIGRDVIDPASIRGLSIRARAVEVENEAERNRAIGLLLKRRPALKHLEPPHPSRSAVMVARPERISVLDYSKGFGHVDKIVVQPDGRVELAAGNHDWGYGATFKPVD